MRCAVCGEAEFARTVEDAGAALAFDLLLGAADGFLLDLGAFLGRSLIAHGLQTAIVGPLLLQAD